MKTFGYSSKLFAISALIGLAAGVTGAIAEPGSGKVVSVIGSAMVGGEAAHAGLPVMAGTVLSTSSDSQLNLNLGDNGPDVYLLADSRATIEELSIDKSGSERVINTKIGLQAGRIQGKVKRTSDRSTYVVQTPNATVSIKGTRYLISADGTTRAWDGSVNVLFRGINYNVGPGQMFDPGIPGVRESDMPAPPVAYVVEAAPTKAVGPVQLLSPIAPGIPQPTPN